MKKEDTKKKFSELDIKWKIILTIPALVIFTGIINQIIVSDAIIPVAKKNDWIGYYGSIITGMISIFGIWLTIGYYKDKDKKEREIDRKRFIQESLNQHKRELQERLKIKEEYDMDRKRFIEKQELDKQRDLKIERLRVKPFLHAREVNDFNYSQNLNVLMHDIHGIYMDEKKFKTKHFEILNTGIGPAVDLEIGLVEDNYIGAKNNFNVILSKEKKLIQFRIHKSNYCFEEQVGELYQGAILIRFKDIHENYYEFEMKFQDVYSSNCEVDIYQNSQRYIEEF